MAMFKAFKPSGMEKIARAMGYQGNMQGFQSFLSQDPMRQQQMQQYQQKAMQMARGGVVRMQEGGDTPQQMYPQAAVPTQQFQDVQKPVLDDEGKPTGETETVAPTIGDVSAQMMQTP